MTTDDAVILVVDDLAQNIKLMDAVLTPRGFTVRTGRVRARRRRPGCRRRIPDLVLLDILMPGMDGYETCRRIRANPHGYLPVVMVTASGAEQKFRAIEAGADDFVTKPFEQAELLARVRSLVTGQALPRHDRAAGGRAVRVEPGSWRRGSPRRSVSWSGSAGCVGSSPLRWPASWSRAATRLPREPPQRDHGGLLRPAGLHHLRRDRRAGGGDVRARASTTRHSATWSSGSRGPSSTSRATGSWSSSTTRSPARTPRSGRCEWRWRCATGWANSRTVGVARARPRVRRRDRAGLRDPRAGGLRGPLRLRRHRHGHQPRLRLSAQARAGQILVTQRVVTGAAAVVAEDRQTRSRWRLRRHQQTCRGFDCGLDAARTAS